jgi:uncharacterized protein YijF (DUF1287 family)
MIIPVFFSILCEHYSDRVKKEFNLMLLLVLAGTIYGQSTEVLFGEKLANAALQLTEQTVIYDPGYYSMGYPNGDVPANRGVCSDVVIRAFRLVGTDLQQEVHEDMVAHFEAYPQIWGLSGPDSNIDHRRVPNLMRFFERYGSEKEITETASDYLPGDVVCWNLGGGVTHIGIVIDRMSEDGSRPMVVHNIGRGQVAEDCLFDYRIIGHYFYQGK